MKKSSSLPLEEIKPNSVFLKVDTSKPSNDKIYYFTDGINALSESMTYKKAIEQERFLKSIGIKVEDRT